MPEPRAEFTTMRNTIQASVGSLVSAMGCCCCEIVGLYNEAMQEFMAQAASHNLKIEACTKFETIQ